MTFWTDLTKLTDAQRAETAWWLDWYHAHAELGTTQYRLTEADPWDGVAPVAFRPWLPREDRGYVFAFRQAGDAPTVALHGVLDGHSYTLTNVRNGSVLGTFTSEALRAGIAVPLAAQQSAAVYDVRPLP